MNIVELFKQEKLSVYYFAEKYKLNQQDVIDALHKQGYLYAGKGAKYDLIIKLKEASDEYLADDTILAQEICDKYGINHCMFSKYMKEYLGKPIKARVKSKFNDKYFDEIDTETKAYLFGFLYADGYISSSPIDPNNPKNVYTIELTIQKRDIEILELMKSELQTPRPILIDDNAGSDGRVRLIVNSMHMWNTLNKYGCTPRKSFTEKFPDPSIFKDPLLIRHFIRGYFDGDGCITYSNKEHTVMNIQILGTFEFLTTLKTYLPESSRNLTIWHNHHNEEEVIRFIRTSRNKAKEIVKYLYDGATIYLTRKFNRYKALCYGNITIAEDKNGEC